MNRQDFFDRLTVLFEHNGVHVKKANRNTGGARINEDIVRLIVVDLNNPSLDLKTIAMKHAVSRSTIEKIHMRLTWTHVTKGLTWPQVRPRGYEFKRINAR